MTVYWGAKLKEAKLTRYSNSQVRRLRIRTIAEFYDDFRRMREVESRNIREVRRIGSCNGMDFTAELRG